MLPLCRNFSQSLFKNGFLDVGRRNQPSSPPLPEDSTVREGFLGRTDVSQAVRGCWGGAACCPLLTWPFGFGMLLWDRFPHCIPPGINPGAGELPCILLLPGAAAGSAVPMPWVLLPWEFPWVCSCWSPSQSQGQRNPCRSCHLSPPAHPDPHSGAPWNGTAGGGLKISGLKDEMRE